MNNVKLTWVIKGLLYRWIRDKTIWLYLLTLHAFHHRYRFVCCIIQLVCSSQAVRVVSIRHCSTRVKCVIILRCMPFFKMCLHCVTCSATYHGYMWTLLVSRRMDDQHLKATENIILNCVTATSQEKFCLYINTHFVAIGKMKRL